MINAYKKLVSPPCALAEIAGCAVE